MNPEQFEHSESFRKNGFVIVRGLLEKKEIPLLREQVKGELEQAGNPRQLLPRHVLANASFYEIPFRKKAVDALRAVMKELCYFPDYQIQNNMFGGWHIDAGSEVPNRYLLDRKYLFAKCGVYLQDNTEKWGGGILVKPKGHDIPFPFNYLPNKLPYLYHGLHNRYFTQQLVVDIKAGDMVFFDSRLPHASTYPANVKQEGSDKKYDRISDIRFEYSKYSLYWNACHCDMAQDFLVNSKKRALDEEKPNAEIFMTDYLSRYYPTDYPERYQQLAKQNNITIASLGKEEAAEYAKKMSVLLVKTEAALRQ